MITKKMFENFATAVDSFEWEIKKTPNQNYILQIEVKSKEKILSKNYITLNANNLMDAMTNALEFINNSMRQIMPGIKLTGDLSAQEIQQTNKSNSNEIAPGITKVISKQYHNNHCEDEYTVSKHASQEVIDNLKNILLSFQDRLDDTLDYLETTLENFYA